MRGRLLAGGVLAAAFFAGCSSETGERAREAGAAAAEAAVAAGNAVQSAAGDAVKNIERASDGAQLRAAETAQAAKDAPGKAEQALERAGAALEQVAKAGSAAAQTAEVKTALIADARVDASGINVDTDDGTKTVRLSGHVRSAAQKLAAGQIAKDKAEGYEVRNELVVQP